MFIGHQKLVSLYEYPESSFLFKINHFQPLEAAFDCRNLEDKVLR